MGVSVDSRKRFIVMTVELVGCNTVMKDRRWSKYFGVKLPTYIRLFIRAFDLLSSVQVDVGCSLQQKQTIYDCISFYDVDKRKLNRARYSLMCIKILIPPRASTLVHLPKHQLISKVKLSCFDTKIN